MRVTQFVMAAVLGLSPISAFAKGDIEQKLEGFFETGHVPQGKDVSSPWMCFSHDPENSKQMKYVQADPILISSGKFVRDDQEEGMTPLAPATKSLMFKKKLSGGHQHFSVYRAFKTERGPRIVIEESEFTGTKNARKTSKITEAPIQYYAVCIPRGELFSIEDEAKFGDVAKDLFASGKKPEKKDVSKSDWSCFDGSAEAGIQMSSGFELTSKKDEYIVSEYAGHKNLSAKPGEKALEAQFGESPDVSKLSFRVAKTEQGPRLIREVSVMAAQASGERTPSSSTNDSYALCLPTRDLKNTVFGLK